MSSRVSFNVLGLMSGTSLDGLDVVHCSFEWTDRWSFEIQTAETSSYDEVWRNRLANAHKLNGIELAVLHAELGKLHGDLVNRFIKTHAINADFIASHGHTVFHQPSLGVTVQIGSGPHIAAATGLDVVCDFRTKDVALGGQGAPLVPIGDLFLFGEYPLCLNLGGIANVSVKASLQVEAFDICLCNMALNYYAEKLGLPYDAEGKMARSGSVCEPLLDHLNSLTFFSQPAPKSLGKEFWLQEFLPVLECAEISDRDAMRTITEHIAIQINAATRSVPVANMFVTGGGAHNSFLVDRIKAHTIHKVVVPERKIVDFKEALIFAFLGVLRMRRQPNALASVTGAGRDNIGGAVYCAG
jgi:anhydro-N-acetylmuramic acid kinase